MDALLESAVWAAAGMEIPKPDHAVAARGEAIAAGLFVDGVPESVALGLTVAEGSVGLALLVGVLVGNVVEAYGAAQPIVAGGHTKRFATVAEATRLETCETSPATCSADGIRHGAARLTGGGATAQHRQRREREEEDG